MRRRAIDLVLLDAGPLITFAAADRLDLFDVFGKPIIVPDVVKAECLFDNTKLGFGRLDDWFNITGHDKQRVVATSLHDDYSRLLQRPDETRDERKDLGEKALQEVVKGLDSTYRYDLRLVLTEDSGAEERLRSVDGVSSHILSTRSFLLILELRGHIPSADAFAKQVLQSGRNIAKSLRDQPQIDSKGNRLSDYRHNIADLAKKGRAE